MKKIITAIITLTLVLLPLLQSCIKINLSGGSGETAEESFAQIEKKVNASVEKYTVPSDDLKEYAKVSDMAALQVKYSELRQITVLSSTENTVELKITAPDLRPFFTEFLNTNKEITDYNKEISDLDESIKRILTGNDVKYVESVVSVPYTIADDNSLQIEETEEFYDAIYGGLLTFIKKYEVNN